MRRPRASTGRCAAIAWAAAALGAAGCAYAGKRVSLTYAASKNIVPVPRRTAVAMADFVDKRENRSSVGKARVDYGIPVPLRPRSRVADWVSGAARADLEAAGYRVDPGSEWKAGGAVLQAECEAAKRPVCRVRLELWLLAKGNIAAIKRQYSGEGARPQLLAEEDIYQLSLEDALREALSGFRREVELSLP